MIVFVDYEHASGHDAPWRDKLLAARTWITYRLEDLSGQHCMLVRYDRIDDTLLDKLDATALFISGNATDPSMYDAPSLAPLQAIVRSGRVPTFGFCGGFQFLATALGAELTSIDVTSLDEATPGLGAFPDGLPAEVGYHPIELVDEHPLLDGIDEAPIVRHAHHFEVATPPAGFTVLASTAITRVQMAVDDERRIVGTQFHPEYYTDDHPAGRVLIENFLRWARRPAT